MTTNKEKSLKYIEEIAISYLSYGDVSDWSNENFRNFIENISYVIDLQVYKSIKKPAFIKNIKNCKEFPNTETIYKKLCERISLNPQKIDKKNFNDLIFATIFDSLGECVYKLKEIIYKDYGADLKIYMFKGGEYWGFSIEDFIISKSLVQDSFILNEDAFFKNIEKRLSHFSVKNLENLINSQNNLLEYFFSSIGSCYKREFYEFFELFNVKPNGFLYKFSEYTENVLKDIKNEDMWVNLLLKVHGATKLKNILLKDY